MSVQLPSQTQPISEGGSRWERAWYEWAWRLTNAVNAGGGGGGGAPTNASYVVLGLDAGLTAERVLTAGAGITITDGGPGGPVTVASTVSPGAPSNAQYVTLAVDGALSSERVLTAGSGISLTDGGAGGPITVACTVSPGVPTSRLINTTAPLTGGGSLASDLTLDVDLFTSVADGIVPASGGGTSNFLRADGTWAAPGGGGGGVFGTAYVNFGSTPGTRLTATVVDASVSPSSIVLVSWGDVQAGDDNDPELDPILFFATPASGQFDVTAVNADNFSGSCRIAYTVG